MLIFLFDIHLSNCFRTCPVQCTNIFQSELYLNELIEFGVNCLLLLDAENGMNGSPSFYGSL
ncbi:hypothetical protein GIB67_006944 [Kingdonia uniflora]|uniref:Uncharacterized protein n=1 Tax=Kingdonia uniflora TaxID=39325 RepID=A0A7J7NZ13_9MAGN|nr:hypothetical protein GIB67_006944 [Kingdonia uniflora]